jgi:hypothetical protein
MPFTCGSDIDGYHSFLVELTKVQEYLFYRWERKGQYSRKQHFFQAIAYRCLDLRSSTKGLGKHKINSPVVVHIL